MNLVIIKNIYNKNLIKNIKKFEIFFIKESNYLKNFLIKKIITENF